MSSRVLRKLQGGRDAELKARHGFKDDGEDISDEEEEEEEEQPKAKNNHLNPFDLLTQSMSESEVKEDDNETENASNSAAAEAVSETKQKKKKRRKKKATKQNGSQISSEDNELSKELKPKLNKINEAGLSHLKMEKSLTEKNLLAVELKHLNPQNEMRRTFGKHVVKIESKRGRQKICLKNTYLVQSKESWPPVTKNIITMKTLNEPDQNSSIDKINSFLPGGRENWFTFEHSQYYQNVQYIFLTALEGSDSDFLIGLIRRCPYHVDSLIQLSELCKMTEDYALAAEFIERAVYILEHSLHPSFSLTSGTSRLDYRRQENRGFFIVLFKYAMYLENRACCRTAFEISKLILTLSPEVDPLAMVLVLDYYAMRSKQFSWLVSFYEEYDTLRNLSQLPNMAYSYALALFCLGNDMEKADKAIQYALLMFPGVLRLLLDVLSIEADVRAQKSSYFNTEISTDQPPALHQLVCLYVIRAKVIWRQTDVLPWLERNVRTVLDIIDAKDPIVSEYSQKRAIRYIKPPRPILRHVVLSDEKVPLGEFIVNEKDAIVAYDPLPPLDSVNLYEKKSPSAGSSDSPNDSVSIFFQSFLPSFAFNQQQQRQQQIVAENQAALDQIQDNQAGGGRIGRGRAAANAQQQNDANFREDVAEVNRHLGALDLNIAEAGAAGFGDGSTDRGSSYRELTQSLTNFVDSMRDFLTNYRLPEQTQNLEEYDNLSSSEDSTDYFD